MPIAAILQLLLSTVPEAVSAYEKIRATMSEADLATLDAELAAADVQVQAAHDNLTAAISAAAK